MYYVIKKKIFGRIYVVSHEMDTIRICLASD